VTLFREKHVGEDTPDRAPVCGSSVLLIVIARDRYYGGSAVQYIISVANYEHNRAAGGRVSRGEEESCPVPRPLVLRERLDLRPDWPAGWLAVFLRILVDIVAGTLADDNSSYVITPAAG